MKKKLNIETMKENPTMGDNVYSNGRKLKWKDITEEIENGTYNPDNPNNVDFSVLSKPLVFEDISPEVMNSKTFEVKK